MLTVHALDLEKQSLIDSLDAVVLPHLEPRRQLVPHDLQLRMRGHHSGVSQVGGITADILLATTEREDSLDSDRLPVGISDSTGEVALMNGNDPHQFGHDAIDRPVDTSQAVFPAVGHREDYALTTPLRSTDGRVHRLSGFD